MERLASAYEKAGLVIIVDWPGDDQRHHSFLSLRSGKTIPFGAFFCIPPAFHDRSLALQATTADST